MARFDTIVGKYIYLKIQGIEYRVYFEENGKGYVGGGLAGASTALNDLWCYDLNRNKTDFEESFLNN